MRKFDIHNVTAAVIRHGEHEEREDPKIVAIGGGTGLSTMLRGLKNYTSSLTAVVTVADNGGSSGLLREDLHMLPPGDIRNCILALANTEPLMHDLMNYRFGNDHGRLSKQCFGNLFIAAMAGVSGNFYDAVRNISKVLAVKGKVVPVSLEDIQISAVLTDGRIIHGESEIGERTDIRNASIYKVFMEPTDAKPLQEACADIEEADIVVLGPGSLYTSIMPNLLFPEIRDSISKSKAIKIYVGNIMTQPAETYQYDLSDHIAAILRHCMTESPGGLIEFCIANNRMLPPELMTEYLQSESLPVEYDKDEITGLGIELIEAPLVRVTSTGTIRHDHDLLAEIILRLWHHRVESMNQR